MAISFSCPSCKSPLTLADDQAGQRTTCLNCGAFLTVPASNSGPGDQFAPGEPPAAATPATPLFPGLPPALPSYAERVTERAPNLEPRRYEEDDYLDGLDEDRDDPSYRRLEIGIVTNPAAWNLVRIGLSMMYWGISAAFIAALLYIVLAVFLVFSIGPRGGRGGMDGDAAMIVLAIVLIGGILASFVVACVGQCMCCNAPPESEARGKAIGSAICLLITLIGGVGFAFLSFGLVRNIAMRGGAIAADPTVLLIMGLLFVGIAAVTGHVLFIGFLRSVARYFHNDGLVQSTGGYLTFYFILVATHVALNCVQFALRTPDAGPVFGCLGLVLFILGLVVLVWYLRLIAGARDTVAQAMGRTGHRQ